MPVEGGYRLSPLARADLEEIWSFTTRAWSFAQAEIYHGGIMAVIEELAVGTKVDARSRSASDTSNVRRGRT